MLFRDLVALHSIYFMDRTKGSVLCARIFKQSMGARNRVGIGLSYRPVRLHRLVKLIPSFFLGSLEV
jgi:hypothetical protein